MSSQCQIQMQAGDRNWILCRIDVRLSCNDKVTFNLVWFDIFQMFCPIGTGHILLKVIGRQGWVVWWLLCFAYMSEHWRSVGSIPGLCKLLFFYLHPSQIFPAQSETGIGLRWSKWVDSRGFWITCFKFAVGRSFLEWHFLNFTFELF